MQVLGSRICHLRGLLGWSQAQLAKKLKVSCKTIKNWETDISDPSAEHIVALTRVFSVSADYLLGIISDSPIYLDALSPMDKRKLRAICQAYIIEAQNDS